MESANRLVNNFANEAFGPKGQPGNPEEIVWVSRMMGTLLEKVLEWARRIRCARVEERFEKVRNELALIVEDVFDQFQQFPRKSLEKLERALANLDKPQTVEMTMVFAIKNQDALIRAFEELKRLA